MNKKYQIISIIVFSLVVSSVLNILNILLKKIPVDLSLIYYFIALEIVSYYGSVYLFGKISKNEGLIKSKITSFLCLAYLFILLLLNVLRLTISDSMFAFKFEFEYKYSPWPLLLLSGIISIFISRAWSMQIKDDKLKLIAAFFFGIASFYFFIVLFGFSIIYFHSYELYIYSGMAIIIISVIVNILSVLKKTAIFEENKL
jgi:hypothetical protein